MRKTAWNDVFAFLLGWIGASVLCLPFWLGTPVSAAPPGSDAIVGSAAASPIEPATRSQTLTFLYTNDHHSHLLPADLPDFGKNLGGIARRESMIRAIRASQPALLVLDGGDIFQGSPFYSFFRGEADLAAYDMCGYDATVFGNHDIDDGLENTLKQFSKAAFPLLCANVRRIGSKDTVFPPYKIFDRGGWKIGVVGVIGSEAYNVISVTKRSDLEMLDPVSTAASYARLLWNDVDVLVLLSHMGYENDRKFADQNADYDLIIGGHTNTFLVTPVFIKSRPALVRNRSENGIGGTLVVQAFKWGAFLGRLDFTMTPEGRIATWSGGLIEMTASITVDPHAPIVKLVDAYNERIKIQTSQVIGQCRAPLAYPESEKHSRDLPLGRFVCDAMREFARADVAILNAGAIRDRMDAGPVKMGDVLTIFPFENTIVTMTMKGRAIQGMLDFIAKRFGKISGYQYGGIGCVLDVPEGVAKDVTIDGKPLDPEHDYRLVTISYLSDGNQNGNELFREATATRDLGALMRDAVIDFFRKHQELVPPQGDLITIKGKPQRETAP